MNGGAPADHADVHAYDSHPDGLTPEELLALVVAYAREYPIAPGEEAATQQAMLGKGIAFFHELSQEEKAGIFFSQFAGSLWRRTGVLCFDLSHDVVIGDIV